MIRTALAAVSLTLIPTLLASQSEVDPCTAIKDVVVGQWAEYQMSSPQLKGPADMRMAIVGSEAAGGRDHYWYEMKLASTEGAMIMQWLVPSYPFEASEIKALVMKSGNEPAVKMPAQMIGMMGRAMPPDITAQSAKECAAAQQMGKESVTVPAGTFNALHFRTNEGDAWVSTDVPFGLLKFTGSDGTEAVLTGHGGDAKSSITETPREMPGMGR
jgi:hypothetical protein